MSEGDFENIRPTLAPTAKRESMKVQIPMIPLIGWLKYQNTNQK